MGPNAFTRNDMLTSRQTRQQWKWNRKRQTNIGVRASQPTDETSLPLQTMMRKLSSVVLVSVFLLVAEQRNLILQLFVVVAVVVVGGGVVC